MILSRDISKDVLEGAKYFPVVAILGPRQSGKTTLSKNLFPKHSYVSLEDIDTRLLAKSDPRTFLQTNSNEYGLIIDEFQYEPELLSYIQTIVDSKKVKGFFVLTGSQNFLMNQSITQSLAGRISLHTLLPLSISELSDNNLLPNEIEEMLYKGCYPAIYTENIKPDYLYKNYIRTYLERDVRSLTQVGDLSKFQTFIVLCAARMGQPVNFVSLGNECGLSDTTVKRWLSILEASYIIYTLKPYHANINKRLVKTPKLYFYDPGLAAYLLKINDHDIATHYSKGGLFESLIISDVIKWFYNSGKEPSVNFWQDKTGNEIDCIIDLGKKIVPVELKSGRTVSQRFFEGLEYWKNLNLQNKSEEGFVIFGGASKLYSKGNLLSWRSIDAMYKNI